MDPEARSYYEKAQALEKEGKTDAALAAYLSALERDPEDLDISYKAATSLLRTGHLDEAASQFRRIVFIAPDHISARTNLGNCQLLLGDHENAEANFQQVLETTPDNNNALFGLGCVRMKLGKTEEAREPAEHLLQLLPESVEALTLYAETRARDLQSSSAGAAFRKALSIDDRYTPALLGLSELLTRSNRSKEAVILAQRAVDMDASNPLGYRILGDAYQFTGENDKAYYAFEKARSRAPKDIDIILRLSALQRKRKNVDEALALAREGYRLKPDNKAVVSAIGTALTALGLRSVGRDVLKYAAEGRPIAEDSLNRIDAFLQNRSRQPKEETVAPLSDGKDSDTGPETEEQSPTNQDV
ncbi:putative TPR repeat-containing protein [Roseibium sp. TrichSKD4]|uniref:tetratricopeptide repeat protein n=1 Tax=Roseibium sp. TrichSKD4 TaxID=744980 RepID=UPI0001E57579|nr:tetratricopeptide repeat protein [Roseibium sp. TrichSKD4]EFO29974.1 putative TPR repeat-containing protein [Roseibium sp. TrichSKD4]